MTQKQILENCQLNTTRFLHWLAKHGLERTKLGYFRYSTVHRIKGRRVATGFYFVDYKRPLYFGYQRVNQRCGSVDFKQECAVNENGKLRVRILRTQKQSRRR